MAMEILTGASVIVTAIYAFLTFGILRENRRLTSITNAQATAANRPYVTVSVWPEPNTSLFYLRIANTGRTAATDLSLSMDRAFYQFGDRQEEHNLARFRAFQEPIACFAPGAELLFYLSQSFEIFGKHNDPAVTPNVFDVRARYTFPGGRVDEVTKVDIRPYLMTTSPHSEEKETRKEIVAALARIEKAITTLRSEKA